MTVLPGLIDAHTHLTFGNDFDPYTRLSTDAVREALNGVRFAKITLQAGFTTVRNVGASGCSDVALRDYIDAGHIPGPQWLCYSVGFATRLQAVARDERAQQKRNLPVGLGPC